jgi:hypothetical protein
MKKVLTVAILVLFASGALVLSGCGKSDKVKVGEQMKKLVDFMKTDDFKKVMSDPAALGKKSEEIAKTVGFKDYGEFIKAKMKVMNEPEIMALDKEIIQLNDKIKAETEKPVDPKAAAKDAKKPVKKK